MNEETLIQETILYVQHQLAQAEKGHDWAHIYRVWKLAEHLAAEEQVNLIEVRLGALLHDIADSKFHDEDEELAPKKARTFLEEQGVAEQTIKNVLTIIKNVSFRNNIEQQIIITKELAIVMDADRLDAMGAIGIARAFTYGGYKNRDLYDKNIPPNTSMNKEDYKNNKGTTINHFYEKLFLLKNLMNTKTGKKIAQERHEYMKNYVDRFKKEWEGTL